MTTSELDQQLHATVLKREEAKEKAYRDARNKYEEEFHTNLGMGGTEMTKVELRKIMDADRRMYYRTEDLNDKLYIHYKGWREIKSLEGWIGLKTLYAECNAFSRISGLETCTQIRSLFLQENCISKLSGLESLTHLWSLNVQSNFIEKIEGLKNCTGLNTLIIAKNKIGFNGVADIEELVGSSLCSLDIQDNRIEDPDILPEVLARIPDLRVLYLKGNPCSKKIVNYRKSLTVYCKEMRYIDDRPVFEDDRRQAEAFNRGGMEEQRAETKRIREEKNDKHARNMAAFAVMIDDSKSAKREKDAMRANDRYTDETDPVESFERRAKRLNDAWKEEHAEEIKDHDKIRAQRILKAEREGRKREGVIGEDQDETDDEAKATAESRDSDGDIGAADTAGDTGKVVEKTVDLAAPVDNRKLVYDDIWDDKPKYAPAPRKTPAAPAAASNAPSGKPTSFGPGGMSGSGMDVLRTSQEGTEVFMPWANGAMGMDSLPASQDVMEKRKAALRAKNDEPSQRSAAAEETTSKGSWHSKYQEQMAKTQASLRVNPAAKTEFKPPSRTPAAAHDSSSEIAACYGSIVETEARLSEAKQGTCDGSSPPALGAGELDEMD